MTKRRFKIQFSGAAIIELDQSVIDVVDNDWRKYLYDLRTPREIAEHISYNLVTNHARLSQLDGWADQPDEYARVIEDCDWDVNAEEMK